MTQQDQADVPNSELRRRKIRPGLLVDPVLAPETRKQILERGRQLRAERRNREKTEKANALLKPVCISRIITPEKRAEMAKKAIAARQAQAAKKAAKKADGALVSRRLTPEKRALILEKARQRQAEKRAAKKAEQQAAKKAAKAARKQQ